MKGNKTTPGAKSIYADGNELRRERETAAKWNKTRSHVTRLLRQYDEIKKASTKVPK